jgi:hypothetical protein
MISRALLLLLTGTCFCCGVTCYPCRGPRLTWDCGLLSNRVQLAPNLTLALNHLIIANCSTTKPLSFFLISAASRVQLNDTFVVEPPGLCAPLNNTLQEAEHTARPAIVPGVQAVGLAAGDAWCSSNGSSQLAVEHGPSGESNLDVATSASDNSSYSAIRETTDTLGIFANTTGGQQVRHAMCCCCCTQHGMLQVTGSTCMGSIIAGFEPLAV